MKKIFNINFLFFLSLFLVFLLPPTDPDLGWHLRCGQEFWQNQTFCNLNQFSVLLPNYSWPNHYWLYQAIIFPIFKFAGLWGLTVFNALLMGLAFFFFFLTIKNFLLEKLLAIGLTIFLAWGVFSFGIRSQELGFLFFCLLLWLLSKVRQNCAIAIFCPLVTLFWANTHGGSVILGLILLTFFFFYIISGENEIAAPFGLAMTRRKLLLFPIFLFSFFITLLSPFGLEIYQDALRHFAGVNLSQLIAEWVPPPPFTWWLILLSGISLSLLLIVTAEVKNFILAFLLLGFSFWALKARRNLPFYLLLWFYLFLTLPVLKKFLNEWLKKDSLRNHLVFLTLILFFSFGFFFRLPLTINHLSSWQNYCSLSSVVYPCKAVEFFKKQSASRRTNIFNRYEWGGFLIWQLPEDQIFVDGRMPAWLASRNSGEGGSVSPYTLYLETLQNQPGWQKTLADYKIDWILINPNTFMDLLLREDPTKFGWSEVYRDQVSVVFKKL